MDPDPISEPDPEPGPESGSGIRLGKTGSIGSGSASKSGGLTDGRGTGPIFKQIRFTMFKKVSLKIQVKFYKKKHGFLVLFLLSLLAYTYILQYWIEERSQLLSNGCEVFKSLCGIFRLLSTDLI